MITFIYNISKPEQGGVGRYTFELLKRARIDLDVTEVNSYNLFGKTYTDKLVFILFKKKKFLLGNVDKLQGINHYLQVEMFHHFAGSRNIVTFHNPPPFSSHNSFKNIYRDLYSISASILFYKRYLEAFRKTDFIIANSEFTKEGILEHNFDEDKIKVIPLGVDGRFKITKNYWDRNSVLGYLGSYAYHKRVKRLLNDYDRNCDKFENYTFLLSGWKGINFQRLRQRYDNKYGIHFLGKIPEGNIVNIYNSFKAFIFPTKWETFGLPIIEAVACGTPVFVYEDAEITPEVKKYTFPIKSIAEVPEKLEELKENELILMSENVKREFNWGKNYAETKKLYYAP